MTKELLFKVTIKSDEDLTFFKEKDDDIEEYLATPIMRKQWNHDIEQALSNVIKEYFNNDLIATLEDQDENWDTLKKEKLEDVYYKYYDVETDPDYVLWDLDTKISVKYMGLAKK